jgi:hypothetical protein
MSAVSVEIVMKVLAARLQTAYKSASYSQLFTMRTFTFLPLLLCLLVAGCARRGVLVEKRLRPSPFAYSAGVDGVYSFLLRDEQGRVHSQMVSPEVYSRYEVGDYFDDQQSGPAQHDEGYSKDNSKTVQPATGAVPRTTMHPVAHHHTARHSHLAHHTRARRPLRAAVQPREEQPAMETVEAAAASPAATPAPRGLDVHP